jgi:hypothetical protein
LKGLKLHNLKGRCYLKVKIINSPDSRLLEKEVNQWLEDNNWVKIINLTQSSTNTLTVISIWYEEPQVPMLG